MHCVAKNKQKRGYPTVLRTVAALADAWREDRSLPCSAVRDQVVAPALSTFIPFRTARLARGRMFKVQCAASGYRNCRRLIKILHAQGYNIHCRFIYISTSECKHRAVHIFHWDGIFEMPLNRCCGNRFCSILISCYERPKLVWGGGIGLFSFKVVQQPILWR